MLDTGPLFCSNHCWCFQHARIPAGSDTKCSHPRPPVMASRGLWHVCTQSQPGEFPDTVMFVNGNDEAPSRVTPCVYCEAGSVLPIDFSTVDQCGRSNVH